MEPSGAPGRGTRRKILVVDDDPAVIELVRLYGAEAGFAETIGAETAGGGLERLASGGFSLVLLDLGLPDRGSGEPLPEFLEAARAVPVAVITGDGRIETAVRCMRLGAFDFLEKPVSPARLMSLLSHAAERFRLRSLLDPFFEGAIPPLFSRIVTASQLMLGVFQTVLRLAPSPLPVLIAGESGTGKELVARAVHDASGRDGPYVPVNLAGLDGALFADVLFGHVRGAYTGAEGARQGLIKRAEGGTLFMDEIGDLAPEAQVKLLRLLQDGDYYPLGSDRAEQASCRVVLATNVDLASAVKAGRFRADLYYRLMIHIIAIPPLRDRKEDLPLLAAHFLDLAASHLNRPPRPVDPEFAALLSSYDFPGNVRELSALVYGSLAASEGGEPSIAFLRDYIARQGGPAPAAEASCPEYPVWREDNFPTLETLESRHIREALRRCGDNQSAAAALLGVSQSTISRWLKRFSAVDGERPPLLP